MYREIELPFLPHAKKEKGGMSCGNVEFYLSSMLPESKDSGGVPPSLCVPNT